MEKSWMVDGKFTELKNLDDLSTEQMAAYTADKNKSIIETAQKTLEAKIEAAKDGSLTIEAFKEYKESTEEKLKGLEVSESEKTKLREDYDKLKEAVRKQGLDIKGISEKGNDTVIPSAEKAIEKAVLANKDKLAEFKTNDSKNTGLVLALKGTVLRAGIADDTQAHRVDGVGQIQRRRLFIEELFTSGRVSSNNHGVIRYTDQETLTDNSAAIAEGALFPSSDIDWIEKSIPVQKIGDSIKISREMMDDVDFVNSEIQNFLLRNVSLRVDNQLLLGNGTAPNLIGLSQSATPFAAGDYVGTVVAANIYDLIAIVSAQIQTGTAYMPSGVLMNQAQAVAMKLEKDADNNYLIPTFVIPTENGDITIDGMKVVVNNGVAANTMYVGDFSRGTVYSSDDLQLEMGYENDDFTKDLVTVKARRRLALLIRGVDTGAFVYVSDVAAAVTAITTV